MSKDNYYDAIAPSYDELHGEEQKKKLAIIKSAIDSNPDLKGFKDLLDDPNTTLLDVGTGTGISCDFTCKSIGIDPSEELLKLAKDISSKNKRFLLAQAESIPFEDSYFDIVICISAIHNFSDLNQGIEEIRRVGNTHFIISVLRKSPRYDVIMGTLKSYFVIVEKIKEEKDTILFLSRK